MKNPKSEIRRPRANCLLPLPEGEGRGEGEQSARVPKRCDSCNRLSDFGFPPAFGPRISDFFRPSTFGFRISLGTFRSSFPSGTA
jgi:hypothetical protein